MAAAAPGDGPGEAVGWTDVAADGDAAAGGGDATAVVVTSDPRSYERMSASPEAATMNAEIAVVTKRARAPFEAGSRARHRGQNPDTL